MSIAEAKEIILITDTWPWYKRLWYLHLSPRRRMNQRILHLAYMTLPRDGE